MVKLVFSIEIYTWKISRRCQCCINCKSLMLNNSFRLRYSLYLDIESGKMRWKIGKVYWTECSLVANEWKFGNHNSVIFQHRWKAPMCRLRETFYRLVAPKWTIKQLELRQPTISECGVTIKKAKLRSQQSTWSAIKKMTNNFEFPRWIKTSCDL